MLLRIISLLLFSVSSRALIGHESSAVVDWLTTLQRLDRQLQTAGVDQVVVEIRSLHREIARWNVSHSATSLQLPDPPADRISRPDLLSHISALRQALEQGERQLPGGAFNAGRMEVNVKATAPQTPTAVSLDESDYRIRNLPKVADALNLVPGVTIQKIGPRNERGVYIRGFDFRQVPLYMDGIPVYVPYDGYVDLDRFLNYDVSEIQVSKGFTSPLYGPNAVGGAINMISKAPASNLNVDLGAGYASGDQAHSFVNAGARFRKWWVQGGFAWLSSETYPLAGDFKTTLLQPDRDRRNAYQTDSKGRTRIAWTPNAHDQYTFTYAKQTGEKGNPPYAGTDSAVRARFWQWPQWDKESFYFIGSKSVGAAGYIRARIYHDRFDNLLYAFDNASYNSRNLPSSFISPYDDDSYGTLSDAGFRAGGRQSLKVSFYFKGDTHREGNLGEPTRTFRDRTYSLGLQDTVQWTSRTYSIFGFSADHLDVRNAQNLVSGTVLPFGRHNVLAYSPQAGLFHALTESAKIRFTFARKTRLPTIKDRYSYRMGQAIPNPELREERSNNFEVGYTHLLGMQTFIEMAAFQSNVSNSTQRFFVQPNIFQLRNLGEARHLGAEFGVRTSFTHKLQVWANYTYLSRRNQTVPAIIQLDTPRHKVYSSGIYSPHRRITAFADFTYEGGRWASNDAGRVLRADSFGVAGIGATAKLYGGIELQTGIHNVLDRSYIYVHGYPEAGRSWYLNLRYRL